MTERRDPTVEHAYYLDQARVLPKIPIDDPRIPVYLEAWEKEDYSGSKSRLNNFHIIFEIMGSISRDVDHRIVEGTPAHHYYSSAIGLGELWDRYLFENDELIAEIVREQEIAKPHDMLFSHLIDIINSQTLDNDQKKRMIQELDTATGHPLGTSAIGMYYSDRITPLYERAWDSMERIGINPSVFNI